MSSAAACSPRALSGRGPMQTDQRKAKARRNMSDAEFEVVCDAFGCDTSFSDFDLGHPGEPDP